MKISVITVVYNGKNTIEDCIKSVVSQSYSDLEYIIIDGGSKDGTLDIINRYKDKVRWISGPDKGIYDAMNKGISLATGDVIGLLNSDDVYYDNDIVRIVADIFANKEIDACYGDTVYVDRNDTGKVIRYWQSCPYREGLFKKGWVPAHPTFYVRRSVYEKYGGFDLRFHLAADAELMMRFIGRYKIRVEYIPHLVVKMRLGGATNKNFSNILKQNIEIWHAAKQNCINMSPLFPVYKIANRIIQFTSRQNTTK